MSEFLVVWGGNGFGAEFFSRYDIALSFAIDLSKSVADVILIYKWDSEDDIYKLFQEI